MSMSQELNEEEISFQKPIIKETKQEQIIPRQIEEEETIDPSEDVNITELSKKQNGQLQIIEETLKRKRYEDEEENFDKFFIPMKKINTFETIEYIDKKRKEEKERREEEFEKLQKDYENKYELLIKEKIRNDIEFADSKSIEIRTDITTKDGLNYYYVKHEKINNIVLNNMLKFNIDYNYTIVFGKPLSASVYTCIIFCIKEGEKWGIGKKSIKDEQAELKTNFEKNVNVSTLNEMNELINKKTNEGYEIITYYNKKGLANQNAKQTYVEKNAKTESLYDFFLFNTSWLENILPSNYSIYSKKLVPILIDEIQFLDRFGKDIRNAFLSHYRGGNIKGFSNLSIGNDVPQKILLENDSKLEKPEVKIMEEVREENNVDEYDDA